MGDDLVYVVKATRLSDTIRKNKKAKT